MFFNLARNSRCDILFFIWSSSCDMNSPVRVHQTWAMKCSEIHMSLRFRCPAFTCVCKWNETYCVTVPRLKDGLFWLSNHLTTTYNTSTATFQDLSTVAIHVEFYMGNSHCLQTMSKSFLFLNLSIYTSCSVYYWFFAEHRISFTKKRRGKER